MADASPPTVASCYSPQPSGGWGSSFPDPRDQSRVVHTTADILRARVLAIACGYANGKDLDNLRADPAFKLACGRLPETGPDLCSQPTLSRFENAPGLRDVIRLTYGLVDLWCASYDRP